MVSDPNLGSAGTLMAIADVKSHYKSSTLANSRTKFKCADCAVAVHAVIPVPTVPGRRRSPSPYFSSSPKRHRHGCTRLPVVAPSIGAAAVSMLGRSTRGAPPTRWVDPATENVVGGTAGTSPGVSSRGLSTIGAVTTTPGASASIASSSMTRRFAEKWRQMSSTLRGSTPLDAPWNTGGTYESASADIRSRGPSGSPDSPHAIYIGNIVLVRPIATGFSVTLSANHADGTQLLLWIQNHCKGKVGGSELWSVLAAGAALRQTEVFALGYFRSTAFWPSSLDGAFEQRWKREAMATLAVWHNPCDAAEKYRCRNDWQAPILVPVRDRLSGFVRS